jgi:hypothetical protein
MEFNRGFWHQRATAFFRVLDLEKMDLVEPLDTGAKAAIREELEPYAVARLGSFLGSDELSNSHDDALQPTLTIYRPRWRADGRMCLSCQLTAMTAFTESDNRWHSYTKSVSIVMPDVPVSFSGAMNVPAEVLGLWPGAQIEDAYMGASYVGDDELLTSLESVFDGEST